MRTLIPILAILLSASVHAATISGGSITGGVIGSASSPPVAGACTDGVDCYCDRVNGGDLDDPVLLGCEDFENDDYYLFTSNSPIAGSESPYDRGSLSRWKLEYGNPSNKGNVRGDDPAPYLGTACGKTLCSGHRTYCGPVQGALTPAGVADCWGPGINTNAQLWIQRSGEFDDENSALTLTGGSGASADVGAGNTHMFQRVPLGPNDGDNGTGEMGFTQSTEVGITMLHAYASNVGSSGILGAPWKHEEWLGTESDGGWAEHWNLGMTGSGGGQNDLYFPYQPLFWTKSTTACATYLSTAVAHVGGIGCIDGVRGVGMTAGGSVYPIDSIGTAWKNSGVTNYDRATDFPYGTWACHRAHVKGLGTSDVEVKIWHEDTLVIHIDNLDGANILQNPNYTTFWWNAYSNKQVGDGLSQVTGRYRDNVHIRAGEPVSCDQVREQI